ncbi:hypothetical protein [Staphylococcus edaphicus]|uniref:Uncharacterized protein n=1 Tax=Staphylococcus edaphicus TaxID=1955013 RepID=A0A2C6WLV4_9STAP|nr:hypothetical protein [Staphylococcus edaphicus]PHK48736.1 hypothetical protein BTJ66_11915 [Staphylococcus edaphicus]UQW81661.1 hypothetical protein MNY58_00670 [Staphylococcus edaphicus]
MENKGKGLKVWAWVFIVLTVIMPLFAIGSIICSIKYKKYDAAKGSKLLNIAIIVAIIIFVFNIMTFLGLR